MNFSKESDTRREKERLSKPFCKDIYIYTCIAKKVSFFVPPKEIASWGLSWRTIDLFRMISWTILLTIRRDERRTDDPPFAMFNRARNRRAKSKYRENIIAYERGWESMYVIRNGNNLRKIYIYILFFLNYNKIIPNSPDSHPPPPMNSKTICYFILLLYPIREKLKVQNTASLNSETRYLLLYRRDNLFDRILFDTSY